MNIKLKAKDFFSVPNLLSYLRIGLIFAICWSFRVQENGFLTAALVILSGLTDILDGKIARRFNMVTDIGKVIDPVADKLTQAAIMFCLISKYKLMLPAFIILVIKELFMVITALLETKASQNINSALWYGKACTAVLYATMFVLIIFPGMPLWLANTLIIISAAVMVASTVLYSIHRFRVILAHKK